MRRSPIGPSGRPDVVRSSPRSRHPHRPSVAQPHHARTTGTHDACAVQQRAHARSQAPTARPFSRRRSPRRRPRSVAPPPRTARTPGRAGTPRSARSTSRPCRSRSQTCASGRARAPRRTRSSRATRSRRAARPAYGDSSHAREQQQLGTWQGPQARRRDTPKQPTATAPRDRAAPRVCASVDHGPCARAREAEEWEEDGGSSIMLQPPSSYRRRAVREAQAAGQKHVESRQSSPTVADEERAARSAQEAWVCVGRARRRHEQRELREQRRLCVRLEHCEEQCECQSFHNFRSNHPPLPRSPTPYTTQGPRHHTPPPTPARASLPPLAPPCTQGPPLVVPQGSRRFDP